MQNNKTGATLISTVTRKDAGVLTLACSPAKVGVATVVTTSVHNLIPGVVQTMKSYGAFIRLACWNFNKTALVPTR